MRSIIRALVRVNDRTDGEVAWFGAAIGWIILTIWLYVNGFTKEPPILLTWDTLTLPTFLAFSFAIMIHCLVYALVASIVFGILFGIFKFFQWFWKICTMFVEALREDRGYEREALGSKSRISFG